MKRNFLFVGLMGIMGVFALSSCSNEDGVEPVNEKTELSYNEAFAKKFGASKQVYNTARQVTLNVDGVDNMKVYTQNMKLVGNFAGNLSSVQVDVPASCETLYASTEVNGKTQFTTLKLANGVGTVRFASVETGTSPEIADMVNIPSGIAGYENWGQFYKIFYADFADENEIELYQERENHSELAAPFAFNATQAAGDTIRLYPLYGNCYYDNEIGVRITYADGSYEEFPMFTSQNIGTVLKYRNRNGQIKDFPYYKYNSNTVRELLVNDNQYTLGQCFEYFVPDGAALSVYVSGPGTNDVKYYSDASLNPNEQNMCVYRPIGTGASALVGLEDNLDGDWDYNDILFYTENIPSLVITEVEYFIAFEDLGSTYDFDFNDVVLKVKHVSTNLSDESDLTVTLLAAGGTLPVEVNVDGTVVFDEIHGAFGVATTVPVNVEASYGVTKPAVEAAPVTVPVDFSIAEDASKIYIVVTGNEGKQTRISYNPEAVAPQAIVLDNVTEWAWPKENISIDAAYPDIKAWVNDATLGLDSWIHNVVESMVVK